MYLKNCHFRWACSLTPVIPLLGGLRQEDQKFEVTLSYVGRVYLKQQKQNKNLTFSKRKEHVIFKPK
jgi:hypothetical protein